MARLAQRASRVERWLRRELTWWREARPAAQRLEIWLYWKRFYYATRFIRPCWLWRRARAHWRFRNER